MQVHVRGGRVVDPAAGTEIAADVFVRDGVIASIGSAPAGFRAEQVVEAGGCIVAPGLVDLCARTRESSAEVAAAVAGGVTTLACPPDTEPPLDEPGRVEMLQYRTQKMNLARVLPLGALTVKLAGERLAEMGELRAAGCVAFTQADQPLVDTQVLYRALQYAATFGYSVWLRPQDPYLAKNGVAHDGEVATRLGLPGIPSVAETIALDTILQLVRLTGARVHICRLSTAAAVDMIAHAKAEGLPVTCDVSVHHLHMSEMDIGYFDSVAHVIPPFRSRRDRDALRVGAANGTIDAICSDHAPCAEDDKQLPFGEAQPGTTGLELLLPLTLKWAHEMKVALPQALARITAAPARILSLPALAPSVGAVADLCVIDPEHVVTVSAASLRSHGKNTPFLGYELAGVARATLIAGRLVHHLD